MEKVSAPAIHSWEMTFKVSITKCLTAQKVDKLQPPLNGRVHSTENNARLSSICVTHLPGQREDLSRGVAVGVTCRPKGEVFLLVPALVSGFVGW